MTERHHGVVVLLALPNERLASGFVRSLFQRHVAGRCGSSGTDVARINRFDNAPTNAACAWVKPAGSIIRYDLGRKNTNGPV